MDIITQIAGYVAHFVSGNLGVEVPVVVVVCLAYLLANDVLDVALVEKAQKGQAKFNELVNAVVADVSQRNALVAGAIGVVTAIGAGGDVKAQIVTALVGVAIANVASLEASTLSKVRQLRA